MPHPRQYYAHDDSRGAIRRDGGKRMDAKSSTRVIYARFGKAKVH
jgi:hypothetical protein